MITPGRLFIRCLGLCCLVALPAVAPAQTVYRCGPAGNSYSQQPCPDGRVVDVSDPRSPAQVNEARATLRAQERWATRAERERRAEEAAKPPAVAGGIGPAPLPKARPERSARAGSKAKSGARPKRITPVGDGEFVAVSPGAGKPARAPR